MRAAHYLLIEDGKLGVIDMTNVLVETLETVLTSMRADSKPRLKGATTNAAALRHFLTVSLSASVNVIPG